MKPKSMLASNGVIPYSTQNINDADIRAVVKVLRSQWLTQGPTVALFEKALSDYTGARYCVAFSSGTAALHGAYFAAGIGKGDEVIMPALTFVATANAVLYLGAKPIFADIDAATGNVNPSDVEKKITKKTRVLVAVDYAGLPADLSAMRRFAKKHKLMFIEDGAQSLGATYKGRPVGTRADMTMFSFHPVKSITTGEGGAIVTNNKKFYEYMKMFRTHGLTRDPKRLKHKKYAAWHQEMQLLGYNYRLTDIQAALGVSQMKRLNSFIAKRRVAAKRYFTLLADVPGVGLPPQSSIKNSAWHLFVIHVDPRIRDKVFKGMRSAGIGVQVHYLPVYLHPYYRELGYRAGSCPVAEKFSSSALSVPLFPDISQREQKYVAKTLAKIVGGLA